MMGAKKTHQSAKLSYVYVSNAGGVPADNAEGRLADHN